MREINKQEADNIEDALLSNKEARELLRVSFPTLRTMIKNGQVKPRQVGNSTRFSKRELINLMR